MNSRQQQRTLKNAIRASGTGLLSGQRISMTLRPAPVDHGVVFMRTDGPRPIVFRPRLDTVAAGNLSLILGNGSARLAGVEHLLAAFVGLGIDNVQVEVDGPEVPAMDGSAGPFVFLIQAAGIAAQGAPRQLLRVCRRVRVEDGDAWAELRPHHGLRIECALGHATPELANSRHVATFDFSATAFVREVARARGHGFGVIAGPVDSLADLEAVSDVAGGGDGAMRRLAGELARHRVLDTLGDLALLGEGVLGTLSSFRSDHALNRALLARWLSDSRAWERVGVSAAAVADSESMVAVV